MLRYWQNTSSKYIQDLEIVSETENRSIDIVNRFNFFLFALFVCFAPVNKIFEKKISCGKTVRKWSKISQCQ